MFNVDKQTLTVHVAIHDYYFLPDKKYLYFGFWNFIQSGLRVRSMSFKSMLLGKMISKSADRIISLKRL